MYVEMTETPLSKKIKMTNISELKKGCGKDFIKKLPVGTTEEVWEEKEYILFCPDKKYGLCPECKAKLLGITDTLKEVSKIIDNTFKEFKPKSIFTINFCNQLKEKISKEIG